jgi:hypothetical protein
VAHLHEHASDETFFVSSRSHDVLWQSHALEKFRVLDLGRLVDAHEKIRGTVLRLFQDLPVFGLDHHLAVKSRKSSQVKSSQVKSSQFVT